MSKQQTVYESMTEWGLTDEAVIRQLSEDNRLLIDIIQATLQRNSSGKLCYVTHNGVLMDMPPYIARKVEKALRVLKASPKVGQKRNKR